MQKLKEAVNREIKILKEDISTIKKWLNHLG
nr:MAG TPA: protein of unknown function (DUF5320) [Caudoviricetes sp.]